MLNSIGTDYDTDRLFIDTTGQKINRFFNQFKPLYFKKRDTILREVDTISGICYIKTGYARSYKISETGEELTLLILKPGDFFPMTLGSNIVSTNLSVEAITPLEIRRAPLGEFLTFIKTNPDVFYDLVNKMLTRFDGLLTRMEYLVFGNAYAKVASILVICAKHFGEKNGGGVQVKIPLTHQDIATMVGITRETACLEMKKLEKKGLISRLGRLFKIKDLKSLEEESMLNKETESQVNNSL